MAQPRFYENNPQSEKDANYYANISKQIGGTCYAHAVAHAVRETESRIIGRNVPSHEDLIKEITDEHGSKGAQTYKVLKQQCDKRRLGCAIVSMEKAMEAINKRRVIVASFHFNEGQWKKMSQFFEEKPTFVYEKSDIGEGYEGADGGGHAVAIVGIGNTDGKRYFKIKNSWGTGFADYGYFRFSFDMPLIFMDVFFRICDLSQQDLANYKRITGDNVGNGDGQGNNIKVNQKSQQSTNDACVIL
eukprot:CAMPEP_0201574560 /NCGR_PEP_ID=MMETSP0190_2-20130828/19122_1 /ASSEMBLY_ACC=CAM_ASM_000263 /TAXON_ID=37353 /ORGANISM="Rosalina sp." /LENGTH=244 /DNA_ID=CAMNT_0048002949 /DNA_START=18 /DNA_END=752 /DNA_ORIENTATION=+